MTSHELSEILIIIVPIGLALLALAVAWGATLTRQKTMTKDITELENKLDESDDKFLTIEGHKLICENNALRFEKHVTTVVTAMGDTLVEKIENIINGGK